MEKYYIALTLSALAGLSTVLGGFITFFIKKKSMKALSIGLGFSAGVMIFLSLILGGKYFGFIGILFGPAMAATICVLLDELYVKNIKEK